MIHPGSGSQHPTNQDVSTIFSTFFFFSYAIFFYHPGVILAFSAVFWCIILVSSCLLRLEGSIPTSSWYHPTLIGWKVCPSNILAPSCLHIYIYIYIYISSSSHLGIILVSSWYHPGHRGLKCQHPGIILLRPSSRQSSPSKIEFFPEMVDTSERRSCNILACRM